MLQLLVCVPFEIMGLSWDNVKVGDTSVLDKFPLPLVSEDPVVMKAHLAGRML